MAVRITENTEDAIQRKKAALLALLQNWAGQIEGYAKQHAPWEDRTSNARQGLHAGVEYNVNRFVLFLAHSMEYGIYLEEGTPPHVIKPKDKKALFWQGLDHPVGQVNHPGTSPKAIIVPTLDAHWPKIRRTVREVLRDQS